MVRAMSATKSKRTIYKVDLNEFLKIMAQIANGSVIQCHPTALRLVRKCVVAMKGADKRELTDAEAAELIKRPSRSQKLKEE